MKRKDITMTMLLGAVAMVMLLCAATSLQAQVMLPYQNTELSFHERAKDLVGRLTLSEKISQMGNMVDTDVKRNGTTVIPAYQYWNEALHGVARSGAATSFPASKAMSATWDRQLVYDCATAISDEARVYNNLYKKGLNYWCPTINMARDPRWGRDEENYGEDPFLAGQLAVQFIKGMQGEQTAANPYLKTVACAKHFAANNYEQGRQGSTSYMTEHVLREYYLPAFEAAVKEGGVKSIMSSYNALSTDINEKNAAGVGFGDAAAKGKAWGGKPNAMNDWLLTGILRKEWGFDGYVTSDCAGVSCIYRSVKHFYYGNMFGTYTDEAGGINTLYQAHATADAIKAGNDMNCEFKNRTSVFQTALDAAISNGLMTEADLDTALVRVLETRFALGEFDSNVSWRNISANRLECSEHQALALKAAQESVVLLKNTSTNSSEGGEPLLPLTTGKKVALIGPYANAIMLGDYSGTPTHTTTPFEAFSRKLDFHATDGTIQAEGFSLVLNGSAAKMNQGSGYLENTAPGNKVVYKGINFGSGCSHFVMAAAAKSSGVATLTFYLDSDTSTPILTVSNEDTGSWTKWKEITATVDPAVVKGVHDLYVKFSGSQKYAGNYDYFRFYNPDSNPLEDLGPLYMVQTSNAVNEVATDEMIQRAVAVAKKADVVVFLGGTDYSKPADHATGTESHDRFKLTMPGNQEDVLKALYAVNKNVVLVLESNSSMDITWEKEHLPAIMEVWYGGQAQGQAICDIIYGDVNPSGKLTSTWYNTLTELPAAADSKFGANGMLEYNIDDWGYTYMYYGKGTGANVKRQAAKPMYPFGYGLSYTAFSYDHLSLSQQTLDKGQTMTVNADITNTGSRDGAEVVQLYVSFPNSAVKHVQSLNRRLVGFERVELKAGETKTVSIPLSHEQLAYFNDATHTFDVEGGTVNVYVSASSADDRLTATINAVGGTVKQTYLSEDTPTAIRTVDNNSQPLCQRVYNVQGTCVGSLAAIDTLPHGLYVAGGKKYVVK
jgi:beta-glucosidase